MQRVLIAQNIHTNLEVEDLGEVPSLEEEIDIDQEENDIKIEDSITMDQDQDGI